MPIIQILLKEGAQVRLKDPAAILKAKRILPEETCFTPMTHTTLREAARPADIDRMEGVCESRSSQDPTIQQSQCRKESPAVPPQNAHRKKGTARQSVRSIQCVHCKRRDEPVIVPPNRIQFRHFRPHQRLGSFPRLQRAVTLFVVCRFHLATIRVPPCYREPLRERTMISPDLGVKDTEHTSLLRGFSWCLTK